MMERFCKKEVLVSGAEGVILGCSCGFYHVEMDGVTLHLAPERFGAVARLFKLALGMSAARNRADDRIQRRLYLRKL